MKQIQISSKSLWFWGEQKLPEVPRGSSCVLTSLGGLSGNDCKGVLSSASWNEIPWFSIAKSEGISAFTQVMLLGT